MKTIYITPKTDVTKVDLQPMMTTSSMGFGDSVNTASGAESRGNSYDDDYWEEDDY